MNIQKHNLFNRCPHIIDNIYVFERLRGVNFIFYSTCGD